MIFPALLAAAAAGVCALPEPAATRDPAAAEAYLAAGDEESKIGSAETALLAYLEAVRLDPSNARARDAYLTACARRSPEKLLDEGIAKMDAGDRAGAIAIFEQLRKGRADPAAALYEGILEFEAGDDAAARPLFVEAEAGSASGPRARYFLGLIELRDGSGNDAAALFSQVAASAQGTLAERAELMRAVALRGGRGVVTVSAEGGYDSNVTYAPDNNPSCTVPPCGPLADGSGAAGIGISLRPLGLSGPYLRGGAFYRKQAQTNSEDLGDFSGQVGWRLGRGENYAFGDYGYEALLLGGSPYLLAHRLRAGGRWRLGRTALSMVYAARFGSWQTTSTSNFSGVLQSVDPGVTILFGLASSVYLGAHLARDATNSTDTSSWAAGPRAAVRIAITPTFRARGEVDFTSRGFDAAPTTCNATSNVPCVARDDKSTWFGGAVEKDFERFTVSAAAGYQINSSNTDGYSYRRFTASLGVSYALGLF